MSNFRHEQELGCIQSLHDILCHVHVWTGYQDDWMIYLKRLKGDDYMLVDENGHAVHEDGSLAYYPEFYTKEQADKLPYQKYVEKDKND
jgi:hypothetical protein